MKAISYFTSSFARHGWYGSFPKVEIPEKTESACLNVRAYVVLVPNNTNLCSTISWKLSVSILRACVPQRFMRTFNWSLRVVAVCSDDCRKAEEYIYSQHTVDWMLSDWMMRNQSSKLENYPWEQRHEPIYTYALFLACLRAHPRLKWYPQHNASGSKDSDIMYCMSLHKCTLAETTMIGLAKWLNASIPMQVGHWLAERRSTDSWSLKNGLDKIRLS